MPDQLEQALRHKRDAELEAQHYRGSLEDIAQWDTYELKKQGETRAIELVHIARSALSD